MDLIDRKILHALKDGPLTGIQLVNCCYRGHQGVGRLHNVSVEVFSAHLALLRRQNLITCTRPGDALGEWSIVPSPV